MPFLAFLSARVDNPLAQRRNNDPGSFARSGADVIRTNRDCRPVKSPKRIVGVHLLGKTTAPKRHNDIRVKEEIGSHRICAAFLSDRNHDPIRPDHNGRVVVTVRNPWSCSAFIQPESRRGIRPYQVPSSTREGPGLAASTHSAPRHARTYVPRCVCKVRSCPCWFPTTLRSRGVHLDGTRITTHIHVLLVCCVQREKRIKTYIYSRRS